MFGFPKGKHTKSVEDFLKGPGETIQDASGVPDGKKGAPKVKPTLVAPVVVAAALLVLCLSAFAKIDRLGREVAGLKARLDTQVSEDMKAQVAALNAKVDRSGREAGELKADMARLERDLAAVKMASVRKARPEPKSRAQATAKKRVPAKKRTVHKRHA